MSNLSIQPPGFASGQFGEGRRQNAECKRRKPRNYHATTTQTVGLLPRYFLVAGAYTRRCFRLSAENRLARRSSESLFASDFGLRVSDFPRPALAR
jgi:hypothetical protein